MAPSRGLACLRPVYPLSTKANGSILFAHRTFSSFTERITDPANKIQSYISRSDDPYLNLSIEDHILRKSPPESTILLLYTNRPCVVIGRNQNPWLEVNLGILNAATRNKSASTTEPPAIGHVSLVRRRSGGGAVFHDQGNVNWSITSSRGDFTRDKHAEMVVRALRRLGIDRARVNERHDVVLDQGNEKRDNDPKDAHRTAYTVDETDPRRPLKVSGSAYKLTRARALHHGTALLASPNLHIISQYLRSPAKGYITAKGVESVRSPVANIGLANEVFERAVQKEFDAMYGDSKGVIIEAVGEELLNIPDIKKGYNELLAADWIYSQTPQFTFNYHPSDKLGIDMTIHHGVIKTCDLKHNNSAGNTIEDMREALLEQKLQNIQCWYQFLRSRVKSWDSMSATIAESLEGYLPLPELPRA
ncbi:hypothetical protein CC78DRAFT_458637 [Lojkania enalia]|uniref:Putative lipoate-protein ligase A n=1 Tax=Lojkania enalia TaxID=147567 RepID=A0A9P4KFH8_9PLEO|nr:hypothetical protein CC78DRAFT_458637 [Didymosphaeria enalia]